MLLSSSIHRCRIYNRVSKAIIRRAAYWQAACCSAGTQRSYKQIIDLVIENLSGVTDASKSGFCTFFLAALLLVSLSSLDNDVDLLPHYC